MGKHVLVAEADWGRTVPYSSDEDRHDERLDAAMFQCKNCGERVVMIMAQGGDGDARKQMQFYDVNVTEECNVSENQRHRHGLNFYPFSAEPCTNSMHSRSSERAGVWQCDCGARFCRDCFEIISPRMVHQEI